MEEKVKKKNVKIRITHPKDWIRSFLLIPDSSNVIQRQRAYVFIYASLGYILGIALNIMTLLGPQSFSILMTNAIHALLILLLIILYTRRIISLYKATMLLIISIQIEIPLEMIHIAQTEGYIMGVTGVLGNMILLGMLLVLSIAAYIRYLPYIQSAISIITLCVCAYITQDANLWHLAPVLALAFGVISFMGDRLIHGVTTLQTSKDNLNKEQNKIFEFLDINKEELFKLIKYSGYKKLTDTQQNKMLELLGEKTKAVVMNAATNRIEKKMRNLAALDAPELALSKYQKEICVDIIDGLSVMELAAKYQKQQTAITTTRAKIRAKLSLNKDDNLSEALLKLVVQDDLNRSNKPVENEQ